MGESRRSFLGWCAAAAAAWLSRRRLGGAVWAAASPGRRAEELARDPMRPQFHLLPAANWMNDPNGPIYWRGRYHMFFQYNPHAAVWGDMHWDHAVSADMVHWRHLPVALSPTRGGPDADGCFSGSAVVLSGVPTFIYTGVATVSPEKATLRDGKNNFRETQCVASSTEPSLLRWKKDPKPVIALPPPGLAVSGFRDPCPWRDGDWWYLNVGSGVRGRGGMVLLYRSRDFRRWEYLHPLCEGTLSAGAAAIAAPDPVASGEMWECPDFFPLGNKHVLIYSTEGKVYWQSGTLDRVGLRFHAERTGLLDYGGYYAPKTQLDAAGQRILWGWIRETRPEAEYSAAGWAGMMSLPRVLDLDDAGQLRMRFLPALADLRGAPQHGHPSAAKPSGTMVSIRACTGEALCLAMRGARSFRFQLRYAGENGPEQPVISVSYDPARPGEIALDGQAAALPAGEAAGGTRLAVSLHLYVDGSVVELLVDERLAVTKRFYYAGALAPELEASFLGDARDLRSLTAWPIRPISRDRLTS